MKAAQNKCEACEAGLPLIWHVQQRQMMHLWGLNSISCARIEEQRRDRKAR